jgi:hypothetical protein
MLHEHVWCFWSRDIVPSIWWVGGRLSCVYFGSNAKQDQI